MIKNYQMDKKIWKVFCGEKFLDCRVSTFF